MLVRMTKEEIGSLTEEDMRQLEMAASRPVIIDEDAPEMSPAMEKAFEIAADVRNIKRYFNENDMYNESAKSIIMKNMETISDNLNEMEIIEKLYMMARIRYGL